MANEKIELKDVVNFFEYEKVREATRARIIELKRRRRVSVGGHLSFVFENRDTVLFQIQEMCRVERITDNARVQDELDVYNALLPRSGELSATLFIEITEKDHIQPVLDRFMGIDVGPTVWIQVGREFAVPGEFEAGHSDEEKGKLSAVHFVRFVFPPDAIRAFAETPAYLVVDHPAERARGSSSPPRRGPSCSGISEADARRPEGTVSPPAWCAQPRTLLAQHHEEQIEDDGEDEAEPEGALDGGERLGGTFARRAREGIDLDEGHDDEGQGPEYRARAGHGQGQMAGRAHEEEHGNGEGDIGA